MNKEYTFAIIPLQMYIDLILGLMKMEDAKTKFFILATSIEDANSKVYSSRLYHEKVVPTLFKCIKVGDAYWLDSKGELI